MIGDGWDGEPAVRPGEFIEPAPPRNPGEKRIAVVTGSRADFGLLAPVMLAIHEQPGLELAVIAAGSHLVPPALTYYDIKRRFNVADAVPMQVPGRATRMDDAEATGRGIERFGRAYRRVSPTWVVVLGDRIEAFAAAAAASIGGIPVAHIHGGDRAEGVADESLRHAITKLAHMHLAATPESAQRIIKMGERPDAVHIVGSPAIDGLDAIPAMSEADAETYGDPDTILLLHPVGRPAEHEEATAANAIEALAGRRVLALDPNLDPGRDGIARALDASSFRRVAHLDRATFVSLLKRLAAPGEGGRGGLIVGNSSAALIECAALKLPAVNIGPRQAGRERPSNVIDAASESAHDVREAMARALALPRESIAHPYGDGHAGPRIAALLAAAPETGERLLRKRCTY